MRNENLVALVNSTPTQKRVKSGKIFASFKNAGRVGGAVETMRDLILKRQQTIPKDLDFSM